MNAAAAHSWAVGASWQLTWFSARRLRVRAPYGLRSGAGQVLSDDGTAPLPGFVLHLPGVRRGSRAADGRHRELSAGSHPAACLRAVVVNSADTSVFQTEEAGSMPADRSRAGEQGGGCPRVGCRGCAPLVGRPSRIATWAARKIAAPSTRRTLPGCGAGSRDGALDPGTVAGSIPAPGATRRGGPTGRGARFKSGDVAGSTPARGTCPSSQQRGEAAPAAPISRCGVQPARVAQSVRASAR